MGREKGSWTEAIVSYPGRQSRHTTSGAPPNFSINQISNYNLASQVDMSIANHKHAHLDPPNSSPSLINLPSGPVSSLVSLVNTQTRIYLLGRTEVKSGPYRTVLWPRQRLHAGTYSITESLSTW